MSSPVTRTKVIIPSQRKDLFKRRRLLDLLEGVIDFKLYLISAPAGYGKSSLLIDFAHSSSMPVCWYSIDPLDRDPLRFIAHFMAALIEVFPDLGIQPDMIIRSGLSENDDFSSIVSSLTNEIYERIDEHFLLVLDDFHLVNDQPAIRSFVNQFLREASENCHTIISSRVLIELSDMALMVARSEVDGLGSDELAFTPEELQYLVLQNFQTSLPDAVAQELVAETEGWITGLLLSTDTMWKGMVDRLRVARVSGVNLYEFFAQQVLDQRSPEQRNFLLRTAYLEEFDVSLCREVLGKGENWNELIQSIQKHILFVQPVGDTGEWIRYHHLFRDFLQSRFALEQAEVRIELLKKICTVYSGRQDWDKAYAACEQLNDPVFTAKMIETAGSDLIRTGRIATLKRWLENLPREIREGEASLLSLQGVELVIRGEIDRGLNVLTWAEKLQRSSGDKAGLSRTLARRTVAFRFRGDYEAALKDAEEAIQLSSDSRELDSVRAEAQKALGALLLQIGKVEQAVTAFSKSANIYHSLEDSYNEATVKIDLGLARMTAGRYHRALDNFRESLGYWEANQHLTRQANVHNNLGVLYYLMGEHQLSSAHFERSIEYAGRSGYERMEAYALSGIGDLYLDLDAYEPALEAYTRAGEIASRINYPFLIFYAQILTILLEIQRGNLELAEELIASVKGDRAARDSDYEQGLFLIVSGRLEAARSRHGEASALFGEAYQLFLQGGLVADAARSAYFRACAEIRQGDNEAGKISFKGALELSAKLDSQFILASAARRMDGMLDSVIEVMGFSGDVERLREAVTDLKQRIPEIRRSVRPQLVTVPFVPPKLTIKALGSVRVTLDDQPIAQAAWKNKAMVMELFYYILAQHRGVTKEELGIVFWPESTPTEIRIKLKNTLYRLRQTVKQDVILFEDDHYSFNRSLDYEYDVEIFLDKLASAKSSVDSADKFACLQEATNHYHGPYLPEVMGSWVWPERERLWRVYSSAVLELAQLRFEQGLELEALENCLNLLLVDPCLESAHRLAMEIYAALGDHAALARQYENCSRKLKEELGADPSPETNELYETLINR